MTDGLRLDRSRIHAHHVGGRDGSFQYPVVKIFNDDTVYYNYEADEDCIEQMQSIMATKNIHGQVIGAAIGPEDGTFDFNINYDPFTSSLRKNNSRYAHYYRNIDSVGDYLIGEAMALAECRPLKVRTIDSLVAETGMLIDYVSLDVHGVEYGLLTGAIKALREQIIGISVEVVLIEAFLGQETLGQVIDLATRSGFRIVRFDEEPHRWSTYRPALGWRGGPIDCAIDILFLKDPLRIPETYTNPLYSLMKLATAALLNGYMDYAMECGAVARSAGLLADPVVHEPSRRYQRLLLDLWREYEASEKLFPVKLSHTFSREESRARFSDNAAPESMWASDPAKVRGRYFHNQDPATFLRLCREMLGAEPMGAEKILRRHGMLRTADTVRAEAKKQTLQTLRLLGLIDAEATEPDWKRLEAELLANPG